jgi:GTP-binding protein
MSLFSAAAFMLSVASRAQFPPDVGVEIAFAGRSNAGKSTAINALMNQTRLARASKTPGRTQLLNYFSIGGRKGSIGDGAAPGRAARIVDLPGYGYADVPEAERRKWVPLLEALGERVSLAGLMLVVDSRRGIGDGDEALLAWANPPGMERVRAIHVLLAKADKLTRNEGREALKAAESRLGARASVQLFSANAGTGVPEARRRLQDWLQG